MKSLRIAALLAVLSACTGATGAAPSALFPTNIPASAWNTFRADGFTQPVSGIVQMASTTPSVCGMPLGCIGTGCIDLETNGTLGRSTIFNNTILPGGYVQWQPKPRTGVPAFKSPFLGVGVGGKTYLLTLDDSSAVPPHKRTWWDVKPQEQPGSAQKAREIYYWGHYPVADLEYENDSPVSIGLRAWSPFIPGDSNASNTPGVIFEVRLRNIRNDTQSGTLVFSFPGALPEDAAGFDSCARSPVSGSVTGVSVGWKQKGLDRGYVVGVIGAPKIRSGGALAKDDWGNIGSALPRVNDNSPGASVSVDFSLAPGAGSVVRFVLAWHAPVSTEMGASYTNMHAARFKSAQDVADYLARNHESLLRRILAWQQAIYTSSYPVWMRDQLVNILHLFAEDSVWFQDGSPDGWFALNESSTSCPGLGNPCCDWYGDFPVLFFYPELAKSTVRGMMLPRLKECPSFIILRPGDPNVAMDHLNLPSFVQEVGRLWLVTGDKESLKELYPSVKKAMAAYSTLDKDGDCLVDFTGKALPNGGSGWEQFWDFWSWPGEPVQVEGFWLSTLKVAETLAKEMNDTVFAADCRHKFDLGSQSLERKLWNEQAGSYLMYSDVEAGKKSDTILPNQLDGQWVAWLHGLPGVFSPKRVPVVLSTIERLCTTGTRLGALGAIRPDGTLDLTDDRRVSSRGIYPAEGLIVGATYMYAGQKDTGLEIARRLMDGIVLEQGLMYDAPNIIASDTGEVIYGTDYYQMMVLWSLPLALDQKDLSQARQPGRLVDRILKSAKEANLN